MFNKTKVEERAHLLNAKDVESWPEDEKTDALKAIEHRTTLLAWIKKHKGYNERQIWEYAMEAEHQDGVEYWWSFSTPEELADDMRRYFVAAAR